MKLLIELPTWLGDSIMATPAIENLINHFNDVKITLIGSKASIELLKNHPKIVNYHIIEKKYQSLILLSKNLGDFDVFFSFRGSFRSKYLKFLISSKRKFQFDKKKYFEGHQVEKYNNFINESLQIESHPGSLVLYKDKTLNKKRNKKLGINAGASYGDAKRWYPKEFANVAHSLSHEYDIVIFGGLDEVEIANEIEKHLIRMGVHNYQNLAARTNISALVNNISSVDLFITGDSGPMHIAAAFQVPSVTIFGPTRFNETCQWNNNRSIIVKKDLDCQPCMKRTCPLSHHNCMKLIKAPDVLSAIDKLI